MYIFIHPKIVACSLKRTERKSSQEGRHHFSAGTLMAVRLLRHVTIGLPLTGVSEVPGIGCQPRSQKKGFGSDLVANGAES